MGTYRHGHQKCANVGIDDEDALDMFADSLEDKLQKKPAGGEEEKKPENMAFNVQVWKFPFIM